MSENPLKQYFRRPSIYIKLPSQGKYYNPSIIQIPESGEIPVYPMTAIDEVTSRTPDALFNGQAVADVIKSCVPCIKDPWKINTIDLDAIIMAIRIASSGETMDINSNCPKCENESKYGINLVELLADQRDVNYEDVLKIRELEIKFKPLTYAESNKNNLAQYEIQKLIAVLEDLQDAEEKQKFTVEAMAKLNKTMNQAFAATIDSIKTPEVLVTDINYIQEFLENCDRQTNNLIKEKSLSFREKNRLKPFKLKCISCQHEYEQQIILNITDFFV